MAQQPKRKSNDTCFYKWGEPYFYQFEFEVNLKYQEMLHSVREFQKKYPRIKQTDSENCSNSPPRPKSYFTREYTPQPKRRENNFQSSHSPDAEAPNSSEQRQILTPEKGELGRQRPNHLTNYFSPTKRRNLTDQQLQVINSKKIDASGYR